MVEPRPAVTAQDPPATPRHTIQPAAHCHPDLAQGIDSRQILQDEGGGKGRKSSTLATGGLALLEESGGGRRVDPGLTLTKRHHTAPTA